jgi:hypothetical protein
MGRAQEVHASGVSHHNGTSAASPGEMQARQHQGHTRDMGYNNQAIVSLHTFSHVFVAWNTAA